MSSVGFSIWACPSRPQVLRMLLRATGIKTRLRDFLGEVNRVAGLPPLTAEDPPSRLSSQPETGRQSRPNGASRAIWAPDRAYSAVRADSRRITPSSEPATRIEPFLSTLPFAFPSIDHVCYKCIIRAFEIQTLVRDQRKTEVGGKVMDPPIASMRRRA